MAEIAADGAPAGVHKGFLARAIGVFVSPGETFEDIARKPAFLAPLLVTLAITAGSVYVVGPIAGREQVEIMRDSKLLARVPEEQKAEMLEQAQNPSPQRLAFGAASQAVGVGAALCIYSLLLWGAGHLLGGEPTYKGVLSALCFASLIAPAAAAVVRVPLSLARDTVLGISLSPAIFLTDVPYTDKLYLFLAMYFDFFYLWGAIAGGIGVAKAAGISVGKGIGAVAVVYVLRCTLLFALAVLFT